MTAGPYGNNLDQEDHMRALILTANGVVDGNLITSRCPPDLPAFCREIFAAVRQAV